MPKKNDAPGMKGDRSRTTTGPLRKKREDTLVKTIEKKYGLDFNVRDDMHLGTLLEIKKEDSLNDLVRSGKGK